MLCEKNDDHLPYLLTRLLRIFILLLLGSTSFLFNGPLAAQEAFAQPPAKLLTSFPFTLFTGGVILIKGQFGDYPDTLNFILDTGSGGISLDSATSDRLHLQTVMSDKTILGIAGARGVRFVYNQQLHLPGLTIDSLNFHVSDYDILSSVYGEKVDGIIGYSFISRYIINIDYDSSRVYVYSKGTFKYPKGGHLLKPVISGLPIEPIQVRDAEDITSRYYFDTGAGLCLLLTSDFVSDSNMLDSRKKTFLTQTEGLGGKANMRLSTVKEVKLGPYRFRKVPTYIFDDDFNLFMYPNLVGLIGNDILRRFNVYLNYEHRDIYLIPNSHFRDQFDYSYSGLSIFWVEGEVRVGDVMKGSPAEKAGLLADDVVVAINNNFSNNIQTYKNMLQNTGEKLKIIVKRNGQLVETLLKVKSIL